MNSEQARHQIVNALRGIWSQDPDVIKFKLDFKEPSIQQEYGVWSVPVASGVSSGNAYELNQALEKIQRLTEEATHQSVIVLLDLGSN